jgi:predicted ATPase
LDILSHESRSVVQLAAVVGRVFWVGAVIAAARVAEGIGTGPLVAVPDAVIERLIQDALRQLVRAELAFPKANVAYSDEQEFIFKNSLLCEVAYSLIPVKNRFRYHLAVALWLAEHDNVDFKIMAAEHFELGGALAEAAKHYEAAAEFALMRGATVNAEELMAKARELREKITPTAVTAPLQRPIL